MLLVTNPGGRLNANQSGYRSAYPLIPANTPPSNYYVLFVADPLSEESETNENNNIAARPVAVTQALTSACYALMMKFGVWQLLLPTRVT